jgi:peptidoglycan hydrolase-like protein with peptidoglycan-binding domain
MTEGQNTTVTASRALLIAAVLLGLAGCAAPSNPASDGDQRAAQVERYDVPAIRTVQRRLHDLGFDAGPIDGAYGPKTRAGILAFQRARGLEPTGVPTGRLLARLKRAEPRREPAEPTATADANEPARDDSAADTPEATESPAEPTVAQPQVARAAPTRPDTASATNTASATDPADAPTDAEVTSDDEADTGGTGAAAPTVGNNGTPGESAQQPVDGTADTGPDLAELELAGTRWRIAGGPNRAILITLKPGGEVEAPVGDWSWQREGRTIRLDFDSGTRSRSTRTGKLVARDRMEGQGRDSFGRQWSWHASRVARSAANR